MSERDQFEAWCDAQFDESALSETELNWVKGLMYRAWQASREALKAERGEDSELLARAKKLEQEVGDIAERLNQSSDSGFMFIPVADLYAISTPETKYFPSYTTYTPHAEDASRAISDGCEIQEYVKLERLQDAMNHPIDTTPNQYDALGKGER